MTDQCFQKGVIDRFENDKAVIVLDDGQEIIWPVSEMPDGATEGEAVRLVIFTKEDDRTEREKMAKIILNEILRDKESDG
ncbi:DUF3006 domain-containing protein [Patescibacteria group bacterium]|nr:DUF3006 domain-containing protein [Patescibacteria group bacterium]MBU1922144.1 DUF3006 domain-containing protein [Patescibacteria group bacterium]